MDDLNLIGTPEGLLETANYLKKEFEMKDLGKTRYCLGLQIEYFSNGIFVHQSTYTEKVLKRFYMDKSHPLSSPMVVRSLEVTKDPFRPKEENEETPWSRSTILKCNWSTNVSCKLYKARHCLFSELACKI